MIRPLSDVDRLELMALLKQAPEFNLYMLGNVETLGFAHELCEFWGEFGVGNRDNNQDHLRAVANRYMNGWTIFGEKEADWSALANLIDNSPTSAIRLQDNPGGTATILPYLKLYQAVQIAVEEVMRLPDTSCLQFYHPPANVVVRRATMDDVSTLVKFYTEAGKMARTQAAIERPIRDTRLWLAHDADEVEVLSAALTNAETADLAMIGGVFTRPEARGKGLSQAVCSCLCYELLAAGKRPVLYWDTAAAGAVYRKLGFQAIGEWRSIWLEKNCLEEVRTVVEQTGS